MIAISVIVPVYNVSPYLEKCLDSILKQTFTDWELLLIDDGSSDDSGTICDQFSEKDQRITVFHQPNSGVSSARNRGIKEVKGDWIAFIDADDWVDNNYLEELYKGTKEENTCLVCMGYSLVYENPAKISRGFIAERKSNNMTFLEKMLCYETSGWCIYAKLYSKSKMGDVRFDESLRIAEDMLFNTEYLLSADGLVVEIPYCCYYYFQREGSATDDSTEKDLIDRQKAFRKICDKHPVVKDWLVMMDIKLQWWKLNDAYRNHSNPLLDGITLPRLQLGKKKLSYGAYLTMRISLVSTKIGYVVWWINRIVSILSNLFRKQK